MKWQSYLASIVRPKIDSLGFSRNFNRLENSLLFHIHSFLPFPPEGFPQDSVKELSRRLVYSGDGFGVLNTIIVETVLGFS